MNMTRTSIFTLLAISVAAQVGAQEGSPESRPKAFVISPAGTAAMNDESQHRATLAAKRRELELLTLETEVAKAERERDKAKTGSEPVTQGSSGASTGGLANLGTLPVIAPLGDSTSPGARGNALLGSSLPPPPDLTPNPQLALAGIADGQAVFVVGRSKVVRTRVGEIIGGYTVESIDSNQVILTKKDGEPNKRSKLTFTIGL